MSCKADIDPDYPLTHLQAGSCNHHIALGPCTGQKVLSLRTVRRDKNAAAGLYTGGAGLQSACRGALCAHQRQELECLCRHITRPAITNERQLWRNATDWHRLSSDPGVFG